MSSNMPASRDLKTQGIILRRTNFKEADRILSVITPEGKISVMARGVRRSRSRLAGGVEMFTVSELMIHFGRSEMGVLTGAKMLQYYNGLLSDLSRLELASEFLKRINRAAEHIDNALYFDILKQGLAGLNDGIDTNLVEVWFLLNLKRANGEEVNLYRDVTGEKLVAEVRYIWDETEEAFRRQENGWYGVDEIKMLRLMLSVGLSTIARVKCDEKTIRAVVELARMV